MGGDSPMPDEASQDERTTTMKQPRRYNRHRSEISDYDHEVMDGDAEPLGLTYSRLDPTGVYSMDGRRIGRIHCGHEDYPCCGCD